MSLRTPPNRRSKLAIVLAGIIAIAFAAWAILLWVNTPRDDHRSGLSLLEAQELVAFRICLPGYLPDGIKTGPSIVYHAEVAGVPEATEIRLRYSDSAVDGAKLEVRQAYTPHEDSLPGDRGLDPESAKASLLSWLASLGFLPTQGITQAYAEADMEVTMQPAGEAAVWLYRIVEPEAYRSSMTWWISNHVEYWMYALLTPEETMRISLSMFTCSPTPAWARNPIAVRAMPPERLQQNCS